MCYVVAFSAINILMGISCEPKYRGTANGELKMMFVLCLKQRQTYALC